MKQKKSVGRPSTKKRSTATKEKGTTRTPATASKKREIKGLVLVALALYAFYSFFWGDEGTIGSYVGYAVKYLFGTLGWVAILVMLWWGWRILYSDTPIRITKKGLEGTVLYLSTLGFISFFLSTPEDVFVDTQWVQAGGLVGASLYGGLHQGLGDVGAFLLLFVLFLASLLLLVDFSLRPFLHKSVEKTQQGAQIVKEHAGDVVEKINEVYEDEKRVWKERWEQRDAFDQEKHKRFAGESLADTEAEETVNHDTAPAATPVTATPVASVAPMPETSNVAPAAAASEATTRSVAETETSDDHADTWHDLREEFHRNHEEQVSDIPENVAVPEDEDISVTVEVDAPVMREAETMTLDTEETTNVTDEAPVHEDGKPTIPMRSVPAFIDIAGRTTSEPMPVEPAGEGNVQEVRPIPKEDPSADRAEVAVDIDERGGRPHPLFSSYQYPPLEMLAKGPVLEVDEVEVHEKSKLLEDTLANFGVSAHVIHATRGPTVTRYELELAPGTKISKVTGLVDELKLALAARDIRMEAPIPGKSAVGIELPNDTVAPVFLRDVLDCDDFKKAKVGIPVGLGKDIAGNPVVTDLAKTPHLLVAGSTGSGKSVCINTLISSILFGRSPEEVKLILVDPKMVELSNYNGIPHLVVPVVTDMKKAAAVLRWATREMDQRYLAMATAGVRDIKSFNEQNPDMKMPLIVIIIDELADLMMTSPDDVEESICRIAQKARAAGIHMVLATQRPTVNIITGTIKANVPSRISFAVAQANDSRTILDQTGAEKLLGKGDMLFNPLGANKPTRVQGAFISDSEVEALVSYVKEHGKAAYDESVLQAVEEPEEEADGNKHGKDQGANEDLRKGLEVVIRMGNLSTSLLQRKLNFGYSRAARLVETMEELGIVGPPQGNKPREILLTEDEIRRRFLSTMD